MLAACPPDQCSAAGSSDEGGVNFKIHPRGKRPLSQRERSLRGSARTPQHAAGWEGIQGIVGEMLQDSKAKSVASNVEPSDVAETIGEESERLSDSSANEKNTCRDKGQRHEPLEDMPFGGGVAGRGELGVLDAAGDGHEEEESEWPTDSSAPEKVRNSLPLASTIDVGVGVQGAVKELRGPASKTLTHQKRERSRRGAASTVHIGDWEQSEKHEKATGGGARAGDDEWIDAGDYSDPKLLRFLVHLDRDIADAQDPRAHDWQKSIGNVGNVCC